MSAADLASSAITLGCARSAAARAVSRASGAAADAESLARPLGRGCVGDPELDLPAGRSKKRTHRHRPLAVLLGGDGPNRHPKVGAIRGIDILVSA